MDGETQMALCPLVTSVLLHRFRRQPIIGAVAAPPLNFEALLIGVFFFVADPLAAREALPLVDALFAVQGFGLSLE